MPPKRKCESISELIIDHSDVKSSKKKKSRKKIKEQAPTKNDLGVWTYPRKMINDVVDSIKNSHFKGIRLISDITDNENKVRSLSMVKEVIALVDGHELFDRPGDSNAAKRNVCYRLMAYMYGEVERTPLPDLVVENIRKSYPSRKYTGFKDAE